MGHWRRSPRRATRRRAARAGSSSSPASRGSARRALVTQFLAGSRRRRTGAVRHAATISRSRVRSARFATSSGASRRALDEALSAGAAPHDIQTLLIAELELPPPPTVLVLEDVHWADDATLDSITVLGRRISSLPALLVLTFRGGEAPPGHPPSRDRRCDPRRRHRGRRARTAVRERCRLARRRRDADEVYAATGGNPFYVTRAAGLPHRLPSLPPSVANAVLGRASRLDDADAPPRRAGLGRADPRRARRCSTR